MSDTNHSIIEVETLVSEEAETSLRQEALDTPMCLCGTLPPTWAFTGQHAMPCSEHLIPFRI
ncbi:hypothetical protein [Candidatus Terasakiella magnetica]|nr:hypothetical protein [Candidatus Terasakiella magnetica]